MKDDYTTNSDHFTDFCLLLLLLLLLLAGVVLLHSFFLTHSQSCSSSHTRNFFLQEKSERRMREFCTDFPRTSIGFE